MARQSEIDKFLSTTRALTDTRGKLLQLCKK